MNAAAAIAGIVLAAGIGRRYDPTGARLKLLQPTAVGDHAGVPMVLAALRNLRQAIDDVIVVVRPVDGPLQQQLQALLAGEGVPLVVNARADDGMGTSLACGVAARAGAAGWLIALADMPAIAPTTVAAVRDAILAGADAAAPRHDGRRGHPVGFGRACLEALLALRGEAGARGVLDRFPPRLIDVDDPGCLLDIDTPEN